MSINSGNNFMKNKKYNYDEKMNRDTYDECNNGSENFYEMSESDIETLELLGLQILLIYINIYGYIFLYRSSLEGIELIFSQYYNDNINNTAARADKTGLKAVYIFFIAQLISTGIAIAKYNILYKRKLNQEINYSLAPNIYIIISNLISIIAYIYLINGAEGIFSRDQGQTILGI